jgi:serine/threonine protein kinase
MIGKILDGRYKITKDLSKGGFGHTFLAQDTKRPGSPICVVKQLKPAFSDPQLLKVAQKLFEKEAETLEALGKHPQIPSLLAYFEENSEFYLIQEYINGYTLDKELIPGQPLGETQVIQLLLEVLEILEVVHHYPVIHRDIKPENIIRSRENNKLFLIDFGAVKQVINNQKQATAVGTVIGTFPYMTLEVCHGNPQFNSDIYALGMIGIKAITGAKLEPYMGGGFPVDSQGKLLWRNGVNVSNELAEILTKMVYQDYHQRYQTAREAIADLSQLVPGRTISKDLFPQPINPSTTIQKEKSSSNKKLLIGLGIAAAIVIPGAFFALKMTSNTPSFPQLATDGQFSQANLSPEYPCKEIAQENIFCQKYAIAGRKGQKLTIEMNSQDLDPQLILLKPDGSQLEINSDIAPNNPNARISVNLPTDGTYTIIARTTFAGEGGRYTIRAFDE